MRLDNDTRRRAAACLVIVVVVLLMAGCADDEAKTAGGEADARIPDGPMPVLGSADAIREALLVAAPGALLEMAPGTYRFDRSLSLAVDGVTLRGAGADATVLSFAEQRAGAEGLLVTADAITLEGFAIEDAVGDAVKINECRNLVVRDVRTEWTGGPSSENGAYGIYPVQCDGVLIEGSVAIGASDAGIYVGQSRNIVVRNNVARFNVAGIEIENSTDADVYGNEVTRNTGGILVFDLPDLPVQGGQRTRVFGNNIFDNNTPNFAPEGNIVGTVPAGTGIMVNANDDIEIFDNVIEDHGTAALMVVSYLITGRPVEDARYDPYPQGIHVHDNLIGASGYAPDSEPLQALAAQLQGDLPAILWDGFVAPGDTSPVLCAHANGSAVVAMLDAPNGFAAPQVDPAGLDCDLPSLPPARFLSPAGN